MNLNEFFKIVKGSFMSALYSAYKFDFNKVKVLFLLKTLLKFYPISFFWVLIGFYVSKALRNTN
ncbi:hypothetical protein BKK54_11240 [Rodentibacter genomosp. 1]|uniref:Uncharacterized protein n=1 Tax=Rodentibacter genomosp. 1 TaxID=1908264 RepID=A0A1V3IZR5_9PAST|nr:hypothetical protein BKK54_11240 [Rodentibacter genomosp. 1]